MANVSTLGQSLDQVSRLKDIQGNLDILQYQLASGKKAREFTGLGDDVLTSQRSRASIDALTRYQENITLGNIKIDVMTRSIQETIEQTTNIVSMANFQIQEGEIDFEEVGQFASDIYNRITSIMNTKYENKYLFAGSDTMQQPVTDIGSMDTFVQTEIKNWTDGTITTDQLIAQYEGANDTTLGYSAPLSSGNVRNVFIRADVSVDINYTVLANEEPFKDVLGALKMLSNLGALDKVSLDEGDNPTDFVTAPGLDEDEQQDNFYQLFNHLVEKINSSIVDMRKTEVRLNRAQLDLQSKQQSHVDDANMLQTMLDNVENVDITDVATKLNSLQVQLEASYRVTAILQDMSLAKFL